MTEKIFNNLTDVIKEINLYDLTAFATLTSKAEVVRLAMEYLFSSGKASMAEYLETLADEGRIRLGPVHGFAACAYNKNGQDYIVLSDRYENYNTRNERIINLAHEVHFTSMFSQINEQRETLEFHIQQWLDKRDDSIQKAFIKMRDNRIPTS